MMVAEMIGPAPIWTNKHFLTHLHSKEAHTVRHAYLRLPIGLEIKSTEDII